MALALTGCMKPATSTPTGDPVAQPTTGEPATGEPTAGTGATCASDADCVITCARPSECCDQLCEPCRQVMHKNDLAAHETWRSQSCSADTCPVARCMPPKESTTARCEAGACVVQTQPL